MRYISFKKHTASPATYRRIRRHYPAFYMEAISISVNCSLTFSRLVTRALAVSIAVMQFTPVSIAVHLIKKPSLDLSLPWVGVSITRSILCPRIKSMTVGDSWEILFTFLAFTPASCKAAAVLLVA